MHIVAGSNPENSERVSGKYIQINGVGTTLEEQRDLVTVFPNGRCDYSLLYIDTGSTQFDFGDGYEEVEAGTFLLYRPGERQASRLRRDHLENHYWIHFSGTAVDEVLRELCLNDKRRLYTGTDSKITDLYEGIYHELLYRNPGYEQIINADIIRLLTYVARHSQCLQEIAGRSGGDNVIIVGTMWDKRLAPAVHHIHVHTDVFNSLDELAEMCHLSKYYFIHLFAESVGMTPHRYMIKLKINKACEMLKHSNLTVTATAAALGFTDITIFRRAFIRITGMNPTDYRENMKS